MRKTIALILAVCTLLSFAVAASADTVTSGTTTLTTKVPAASYTMKIPADQTIQYGVQVSEIGNVTIEKSEGFSANKNVEVTVGHTEFTSEGVNTTIPYEILTVWGPTSGTSGEKWPFDREAVLRFEGQQDGTVKSNATTIGISGVTKYPSGTLTQMAIRISSGAWANALAGDYTSTITFTSKVVAIK